MANPVIIYNASSGSDTAASGAGPATAITGSGAAHTNGTSSTTITLTNSPDLSGVAADDILWLNTSSGSRHLTKITAVDDGADTVTVEDSFNIGSGSAVDYAIGGKRQTIQNDGSNPDLEDAKAGWIFELEAGTYNISQETDISAGDDTTGPVVVRNADGAEPLLRASGTTDLLNITGVVVLQGLDIKGSAWRHGVEFSSGSVGRIYKCKFRCAGSLNFPLKNAGTNASMLIEDCYFIDEGSGAASSGLFASSAARTDLVFRRCYFEDGLYAIDAGGGTTDRNSLVIDRCIFNNQTTAAINADATSLYLCSITNNVFYSSAAQAVILTGATNAEQFINIFGNIFSEIGTYGVDYTPGADVADGTIYNDWNAFYNMTSGNYTGVNAGDNDISLTTDPFESSGGGDFRLNNNAGGGLLCRGVLPDGPQTGIGSPGTHGDLGIYQHQQDLLEGADVTDNLVGHWEPSIDDAGNGTTTLTDETGSNNGTLTNMDAGADWVTDTGVGGVRAIDFNETDSLVEIGDADAFTFGDGSSDNPFSISMWVYARSTTSGYLISKWDSTNGREYFVGFSSGQLLFRIYDHSNGKFIGRGYASFPSDVWVHVCACYTGSGSEAGVAIYINGIAGSNSSSDAASYVAMENGTATLCIGNRENEGAPLDGLVDSVRLYSTALSADERFILGASRPGRESPTVTTTTSLLLPYGSRMSIL